MSEPATRRLFLCGQQRSGKDTVAAYLAERYGATRYALSEPLYAVCRTVFGMDAKDRDLLIRVGAALRSVDGMCFCKALMRRIEAERPAFAVVTDVRMPHEVAFFTAAGFGALRLTAPAEVRMARGGFTPSATADATEQELDVTPVVPNCGSVADLLRAVDAVLHRAAG